LVQMKQAAEQIPPEVSTVPIDPDFDDHASEFETCLSFINSPKGRKMKNGSEQEKAGFANVRLHATEHKAIIDKNQKGPQGKPPSESIQFKDMPPDGQVQMAAQAGIKLDPQALAEKQAQDAQAKKPPLVQ